ncbi:LysR family transcriptional regulator [Blautia sp.]
MDTKQLTYITEIAKWGNMTKAAQELYVAQSTLSQYLTRLEKNLGVPLFIRAKNAMILTPEGELYVESAKKIIQIQDDLYSKLTNMNHKRKIRICVTSSFAQHMLSQIIPLYKENFPETDIYVLSCNITDIPRYFDEDLFDMAIAASNDPCDYHVPFDILRKEKILFAVSQAHPYTTLNPTDQIAANDIPKHFSDTSFVCSQKFSTLGKATEALLKQLDFKPQIFCYTDKLPTIRKLIISNQGAGFIPESCSADRKYLKYYNILPEVYRFNVALHKKGWPKYQYENGFYDLVCNYFKQLPDQPYIAEADSL